jgi:hypothetical protein
MNAWAWMSAVAVGGAIVAGCTTPPRAADELAAVPARAAKDSALGRCRDSRNVDLGRLTDVVADPEDPADRINDGVTAVARDSAFRVIAMTDNDDGLPTGYHGTLHATAVAIIDTLGRTVRGSVVVTQSDGMEVTRAVCEAFPHMRFHPARDGGRKVRALYREEFVFYILQDRADRS